MLIVIPPKLDLLCLMYPASLVFYLVLCDICCVGAKYNFQFATFLTVFTCIISYLFTLLVLN